MARRRVLGNLSLMMSSTGRWLKLSPRSPWTTPGHVVPVLGEEGLVEVVPLGESLAQGVGHRLLAGEGPDRVSGDGEDHGEDEKVAAKNTRTNCPTRRMM